ncbi:hypothetical protein EUX57_12420 [Pseudomonas orientalis]|uniref:Uncharacterized protein n=1 Tax=Pseudomonas orientalis TaxID=76758 RepID=A0A4Q7D528_9PSED|nr:hypothetical protein EUX57_12420 [Pseudomonas orientalis]
MNIERTQHIGHYGVIFTVIRFTVVPGNRHALAAPISLVSRPIGGIAGTTASVIHAGDVVIGLDAEVNGGIGPQRSMSAMVRPFQGG